MRKFIVLVVLCLFVYGVTKVTIAGDIVGYVCDTNDKALSRVGISTKDDYKVYSEETSGSGHYSLSLRVGTYTIKYEKQGYQSQTNDISLRGGEYKYLEMIVMVANQIPTLSPIPND